MSPWDPADRLERAVAECVRDLPLRRAPATLESRVLGAIAARAALPWWRRDFMHWPLGIRLAFLCIAALATYGVLNAPEWLAAFADLPPTISWIAATTAAIALIAQHLPTFIYVAALGLLSLYLALFSVGALAYRSMFHRGS